MKRFQAPQLTLNRWQALAKKEKGSRALLRKEPFEISGSLLPGLNHPEEPGVFPAVLRLMRGTGSRCSDGCD